MEDESSISISANALARSTMLTLDGENMMIKGLF